MQMRWFIPQTKHSRYDPDSDEASVITMDHPPQLQYRYMRKVRNMKAREWRDDARVDRWSPWMNIPTVEETK